MKNEIKINGTQKFMGMDIPVVEGGFGEDQKVILVLYPVSNNTLQY